MRKLGIVVPDRIVGLIEAIIAQPAYCTRMVIRIAYENTAIKVWFLFDEWVSYYDGVITTDGRHILLYKYKVSVFVAGICFQGT